MLTHYTKKIDGVVNILSHGFAWVANRRNLVDILIPHHDYSEREPQQFGMVSFTEATPEEARSHSDAFGQYGIIVSDEGNRGQTTIYLHDRCATPINQHLWHSHDPLLSISQAPTHHSA